MSKLPRSLAPAFGGAMSDTNRHGRFSTLSPMKLDDNHASIQEAIDAGLLAGAVTLVWRSGEVLRGNDLGHRDVDARLPMERDTIFRIASMTKPVTIAAAM